MCPTVVIFKLRSAESANKSTAIGISVEITTSGLRGNVSDDEYFPTTVR